VDVDVAEAADGASLRARVGETLERRLEAIIGEGAGPLEVVSCRVRLRGRTALGQGVEAVRDELRTIDLGERDGVRLVVERVEVDTRPALDLEELARGSDAPGRLARLLLDLDPDPGLADRAERAAEAVMRRSHYVGPGASNGPEPVTNAALRRQAARLLDALMRQKEPA
jgi:DNA repair protein SbcD/Mre11